MFDALTARAIGAELNDTLAHGRVQAVVAVAPGTVGLEVYAHHERRYLLASADPERPRLHLVSEKLRAAPLAGSAAPGSTPFMLLLKKYAEGAFVNRIEVVPRERILRFEFDHHVEGISTLVVELMGRLSNLILLDAGGFILDAVRRVPPAVNRVRAIQPREQYLPPPPQKKADPLALDPGGLDRLLARASPDTLALGLVETVAGTSPLFARELAFRVMGSPDAPYDPSRIGALAAELARVWHDPPEPTLAYDPDDRGDEPAPPIAVAAFALASYPRTERLPSMSAALERFFGADASYEAVKAPYRQQIAAALDRLQRTRASLQRELRAEAEIEELRLKGEMVLGYQHAIAPGQTLLRAETGAPEPLDIVLDPQRSAVENAQKYFAEYKRARQAAARVPERLAETGNEIAYVEQVLNDLDTAETRAEIDEVLAEAREARLLRAAAPRGVPRGARSEPHLYTSPDGFQILVGRNARQNEEVTFERAGGDDLWLHARGHAGAHVVVLTNGARVPPTTVEYAGQLAAYYSQARSEGWVDVIVAPRKHVRRVSGRGAHPGLVTVREERVIRVKPVNPTRS